MARWMLMSQFHGAVVLRRCCIGACRSNPGSAIVRRLAWDNGGNHLKLVRDSGMRATLRSLRPIVQEKWLKYNMNSLKLFIWNTSFQKQNVGMPQTQLYQYIFHQWNADRNTSDELHKIHFSQRISWRSSLTKPLIRNTSNLCFWNCRQAGSARSHGAVKISYNKWSLRMTLRKNDAKSCASQQNLVQKNQPFRDVDSFGEDKLVRTVRSNSNLLDAATGVGVRFPSGPPGTARAARPRRLRRRPRRARRGGRRFSPRTSRAARPAMSSTVPRLKTSEASPSVGLTAAPDVNSRPCTKIFCIRATNSKN